MIFKVLVMKNDTVLQFVRCFLNSSNLTFDDLDLSMQKIHEIAVLTSNFLRLEQGLPVLNLHHSGSSTIICRLVVKSDKQLNF